MCEEDGYCDCSQQELAERQFGSIDNAARAGKGGDMVEQKQEGPDTLAEYDDDTLAEMADKFAEEAERLGRLARGAHAELQQRMRDRGGTKLETPHWSGVMKPGPISHTVDDLPRFRGRLYELPNLSLDEINAAFVQPPPPPMRPDHRVLNELHKRGGEIAAIIDEERRSVRGESVLVLKRKSESEIGPVGVPR